MAEYKICLLSFLRKDELIPESFHILKDKLAEHYSLISVIISESYLYGTETDIINIVSAKSTKYRRIKRTFNLIDAEYYFCMDSDITLDIDKTLGLIYHSINNDSDISWGRIGTSKSGSVVERLIDIDKILSHSIIRPALWKLNVGITIPGQVFLFKKESLIQAFDFKNTFLDDLAVGSYVRKNIGALKIWSTKNIIGFEVPSESFGELLNQRKRWAKGYKSMYSDTRNTDLFKYVLTHGFSYHFLWIPLYCLFALAFLLNMYLFSLLVILTAYTLSGKRISKLHYSITYLIVFPIIHIWWFFCFLGKVAE